MKKSRAEKLPKILVILGPTATGKSALAVKLAKEFNGEIISADSRQVYKGLDIGTGKITLKEMKGVPHHLLDIASPKTKFNVSKWQKLATRKIQEIHSRGKLPIICGGTGFYIDSITKGTIFPEVPPNRELRKNLESKSANELVEILRKLDKNRLRNIDQNNPVRLIRAIEIAKAIGEVPEIKTEDKKYDVLSIGLTLPNDLLKEKINIRLKKRKRAGMINEAKKLHEEGLSWKRMFELGLEYRYLALFLQSKISKSEMMRKLETEIWHYARRQKQWFKRDKSIRWFELKSEKVVKIIKKYLS